MLKWIFIVLGFVLVMTLVGVWWRVSSNLVTPIFLISKTFNSLKLYPWNKNHSSIEPIMPSILSTIWNKERETRTVNVDGLYSRRMRQSENPWLGMSTGRIDKTKYFDVQETLKRHNKDRMIRSARFPRTWDSPIAGCSTSVQYGGLLPTWDRTKSEYPTKRIWKRSEKNSTKKDMKSKFNFFRYWFQNFL